MDLNPSEQDFYGMLMEAPAAIAIMEGPTHRYRLANPIYQKIFGRTEAELIGRTIREVWPEIEQQGVYDIFDGVYRSGTAFRASEFPVSFLDEGAMRSGFYDFIAKPLPGPGGKVKGIMVHAVDVTEKTLARRKAELGEKRFSAAITAVDGILWTNNARGEMEGEQPGWAALTGQSHAEYQGYGWASVVHPEDAGPTVEAWNRAVESRCTFVFEHRLRKRDGQWGLFSIKAVPIMDAAGDIVEWVGVHTDITEQRKAAQQVRESEQRFQNLVRDATVGIIVLMGPEMLVAVVNDAYARLIGRTSEELLRRRLFEIIPETESTFRPIIDGVRESGESLYLYDTPYTVLDSGGKKIEGFLNLVYQPYREADGSITGVMVLCQDMTAQVISRRKAEEAEETTRLAVSLAGLGTFDVYLPTNRVEASERMRQIFGMNTEDDRERFAAAVHPEDIPIRDAALEAAHKSGLLEYEVRIIRKDGAERWVRVRGRIFHSSDAAPQKLTGVIQDITEEKTFAAELTRLVRQRTQELEQFTFVSHHDLQEPLRKMLIFTDMIRSDERNRLTESGQRQLSKITDAAMRMSKALRDVLDYASLDRKDAFSQVDLNEILSEVTADLEVAMSEKAAVLQMDPLPVIRAVHHQMHQLFYNLVNNALKFSRAEVPVRISIRVSGADTTQLARFPDLDQQCTYHHITVSDNGIGFDPVAAEKIFVMFQRLHTRDAYSGTGVGLALCRKVAENHGGRIWAEGAVEEGAQFHLLLPGRAG